MHNPSMVQFLAEKMVENGEDTMFGAMVKIMWAILWTHEKRFVSMNLDPIEPPHEKIIERSLAVGLRPPRPSQIGAWTHMICTSHVDPVQFANMEYVEYVRHALGRRTMIDAS